jgi:hypothetical protein
MSSRARLSSGILVENLGMKLEPAQPQPSSTGQRSKRRGVLLGVAALGAGALAARVLPGAAPDAAIASPKHEADTAAGYRESEHVLRYYETTRI